MFSRYAIYFTAPPASDLAQFGASWLGWDSASGQTCTHPDIPGVDVATITATPRKYGFHGTLKPPFRLAAGTDQARLEAAFHDFCSRNAPVQLEGLKLSRLGAFMALTPVGDAAVLAELAAKIVISFDDFRAPLTQAELARRRKSRLNPAQEAHLAKWGYPYVMDQFRYHMTLTGRISSEIADLVARGLEPMGDVLNPRPYDIDALTLLGEDENGMFHQLHRARLAG